MRAFVRTVVAVSGLLTMGASAFAGDTLPPNETPDKSRYTLFNPVPDDQQRDFNSDRPSRFTSPTTVDPGHFQLEVALVNYLYDRYNIDHAPVGVDAWNVAPFDLRVGLTKDTEIDFIYLGYTNQRVRDHALRTDHTQSGFGDLFLLYKYSLLGNEGGTFAFGLLPFLKVPTNTAHLGNRYVEGGVEFPLSVNLPANFQLGIEVDLDALRNDANTRYEAAFAGITYLGYSFLDKKLTFYAEWYSRVNQGPDSAVDGEVGTGLVYYLGKNAEVDGGCYFGVTRAAPDYQPFLGFSVRY